MPRLSLSACRRLALPVILALSTSALAQQNPQYQFQNYAVSFAPGSNDADGHFLGGTEIRDLVSFGGKLYAGNSYWMDQPGPEGKRTGQVLVLDAADAQWRQDVDFGDFCPQGSPNCALATGALAGLYFSKDKDGAVLKPSVGVLAASIWPVPNPAPVKVYARNNNDYKWYETVIADTADNGQARSFGTHVDSVTGESLAFVSGGSIGIYHGWLSPKRGKGQNPLTWAANPEWNAAGEDANACSGAGKRVMAFAEAQGSLFASQCFDIMKRTDGPQKDCKSDEVVVQDKCQQRWQNFWTAPNASNSESGLRGMTMITYYAPGAANGDQELLVGYEGGANAVITRVDPKTATGAIELDVSDTLAQAWGMPVGYIITSYSGPMPIWYGADGRGRRIIGLHANIGASQTVPVPGHSFAMLDTGARLEGDAWYFLRDKPYSFRLFKLPPVMTTRMASLRAAVSSPFASDCNDKGQDCAIYFGGFDAAKSATVTPCFAKPCSAPPVPMHNTGFIVKGWN